MTACQLCGDVKSEWASDLVEKWIILDKDRKWRFYGCEDCWKEILLRALEALRLLRLGRELAEVQ